MNMQWHWYPMHLSPLEIALIIGGFIVLCLILAVVGVVLYMRARNRERMVSAALASNQPEFALYLLQGPRRFFAGLVLLCMVLFMFGVLSDAFDLHMSRGEALAMLVMVGLAAIVCLFILFKRPRIRGDGGAGAPRMTAGPAAPSAPAAAPGPATAAPQEAPRPFDRPAAPPLAQPTIVVTPPPGESFLDKAIAVALAVVLVFAGLTVIGLLHWLAVPILIVIVVYLILSADSRAKFMRGIGRATGSAASWFNNQADAARRGGPTAYAQQPPCPPPGQGPSAPPHEHGPGVPPPPM